MIVNIENFFKIYGFEFYLVLIKLNGKKIDGVIIFDESEGWFEKYVIDENGEFKMNEVKDLFVIECLFG